MHGIPSEKRFQLLADQALEHAIIMMDADGVIVEWSAGAERLFGWTSEEAHGQPAAMIFTGEDRRADAHEAELRTALALGRSGDVRWHLRKDGSAVFCDGIVTRILGEDGQTVLGFGKIVREALSHEKTSNAHSSARSEQRSFLAAVLESVENGIVACDPDGRLTFFNDAARRIHGMQESTVMPDEWAGRYGLYAADGETPLPLAEVPLFRALQGERVESSDVVIKAADGVRRHVKVSGRPLRDGAGDILGAVISMNDVSSLHEVTLEQERRRQAEASQERLRKAEEQLRVATDAAGLGIWTWDAAHDRGTWENEQMVRIFGLPPEPAVVDGVHLLAERLHPDDAALLRQAIRDTVEHGRRLHFIGRVQARTQPGAGAEGLDDERWIELTGVIDTARPGVIVGTASDITVRKQLDRMVEESRIRLAATLTAGEVASFIWDIPHDRMMGDGNLARLFDLPDSLTTGAPLSVYTERIHPADLDQVFRQIRLAIDTREPYRAVYRIRQHDGRYRWVNARGRVELDAHGQPEFLAGVLLDITGQKETEDALREAQERYRTLIASMDQGFALVQVLVDDAGRPNDYRFEEINRSFEEQSGLYGGAGKTIREMVPAIEARWIELYGRVALEREPARFTEHSAAMGYWWDVYATPMGEPEERRIAILFSDVTASRQAEENLRQLAADLSETNRRKTEFLATLAHELRNPLAPMRTGLDLLRMAGKNAQSGAKVIDMMERQLRQMVHLIDDLMDVSRINSGKIELKRERIDLRDAVGNAVESALPAVEAARHALAVELPDEPLTVDADPARLAQILGNLLTNAVKYTPNGGRLTVAARREGDAIVVAVTDSGLGIPLEEQGRVFDMFSQVSHNMGRAQGGLGIGLSLVRSLAEMHGGAITVASRGPGEGSTFTLRLPVAGAMADAQASAPEADGARDAGRHGLQVVVADDNVDAAIMLGSLLEASGHGAEIVHDGVQAEQKIIALKPDLAILDIGMPGLNGYEVARRIRARPELAGTVLVALTGWGGELDRSRSEEAGFDAHLTKPAGLDELDGLIARFGARALAHAR
jgi:PAS domain S-box-containing protein